MKQIRMLLLASMVMLFTSVAMAGTEDNFDKPNILWHNSSTGAIKFMPINNMMPEDTIDVADSSNLNLLPRGIADFTGDDKPDILFHNQNSGNLRIWEMNGTVKVDNIQVLGSSNTNLQIAGVGDFDLNGDTDIATFNTNSGALRMWIMEGTTRIDNVLVLTGANTNLIPSSAGDMDGDGIPDLVLRNNNSGAVRVWTMNSDFTRKGNEKVTSSSNTNLELRGVVDINKDGNNDILNYNTNTGKLRAWLMDDNLTIISNEDVVQYTDLDWSVRDGYYTQIVTHVSNTVEFRQALFDAAQNGFDDKIILADGIYKTTDDGEGTFQFVDNEGFDLILQGAGDNVILSGDKSHQILKHNSTVDSMLKLDSLTFKDGNTSLGGGAVYTSETIYVNNCNFVNNNSEFFGGGFHVSINSASANTVTVTNSNFIGNSSNNSGGGFYTSGNTITTIRNTSFSENIASTGGGFCSSININYSEAKVSVEDSNFSNNHGGGFLSYAPKTLVHNSLFINNTRDWEGAGFFANHVIVSDSKFIDNNVSGMGGGFFAQYATVTNSYFKGNRSFQDGGGFRASWAKVVNTIFDRNVAHNYGGGMISSTGEIVNSIFIENNSSNGGGIYFYSGESTVLNSVFSDNNVTEIAGGSGAIVNLVNNYIDINNIDVSILQQNNIFTGADLGFVDYNNSDFHLRSDSILIDAGVDSYDGIDIPTIDYDGNPRPTGASTDIGPYEYQ